MNKLRCPRHIVPRARTPIRRSREIVNHDLTMVYRKVIKNDSRECGTNCDVNNAITNNCFDYDSTDSDSSIDDTSRMDHSIRSILPLDDSNNHNAASIEARTDNSNAREDSNNVNDSTLLYFGLRESIMMAVFFLFAFSTYKLYCHLPQNNRNDRLIQTPYDDRGDTVKEFGRSVQDIKLKFKSQKFGLWNAFSSQVEEIINESAQISMIVLLGNETNTVTCLAHLLGSISSKALGGDNYLTLNARNIGNDHGEVINKLKAEIRINRVVIVEDLLTMSSEVIKVFHSLCDKENPLISKAIYIITIVSSDYEGSHEDKFVEDRLTAKFSKAIDLDTLNPLITRIMDGPIISVLPEPSIKGKKSVKECRLL